MTTALSNAQKILIAGNQDLIGDNIQDSLKSSGYVVVASVATITAMISAMGQHQPDLVLIDWTLADPAAVQQIQVQYRVPIVYLIENIDDVILPQGADGWPYGYLLWPFDRQVLRLTIELALVRHRAAWQMQRAVDKVIVKNQQMQAQLESNLEYMAIAAHDLRNPLGVIRSVAEVLGTMGTELAPERQARYLQRLLLATTTLDELLTAILTYNYVIAGKLDAPPVPIDFVQFCREQVEAVCADRPIQFDYQANHCPTTLNDRLLTHIVPNLLRNAIGYSAPNSPIVLRLTWSEDWLELTVQDQGRGIPLADQARLFEPFFRGENVGEIPGAGLGLAIAQACADRQGGSLQLVSTSLSGSCFKLQLPRDTRPSL
jgi:signal transduction histidine kinase